MEQQQRLVDSKMSRDRIQAQFDAMMNKPFFKAEADTTNAQKIKQLSEQIDARDKEITTSRANILRNDSEAG